MKVGILTLTGDNNYGNKLQNYALQHVLETLGHTVKTIRVSSQAYSNVLLHNNLQRPLLPLLPASRKAWVKRRARFLTFNRYIHQLDTNINPAMPEQDIIDVLQNFDFIVYGSDQIWNTEFKTFSELYLGKYAAKEKNIAISASFGTSDIDREYQDIFKDGLLHFKALSAREQRGVELIRDLTGLEAKLLIDPTMALNDVEWEKVETKVKEEDYILVYFLGDTPKEQIEKLQRDMGCQIKSINPETSYGPQDFLGLIHHAKCVCTDSYHACVFSILFQTAFYVYERQDQYSSMNTRLHTLLHTMQLEAQTKAGALYISKKQLESKQLQTILSNKSNEFYGYLRDNIDRDDYQAKAYACYHKSDEIRQMGSSGGIYYALAKAFIDQGGTVYAACYDEQLQVVHREITDEMMLVNSCGSKYAPSDLGDTYLRIQEKLTRGEKVLFVGTSCQCAGLRSFLKDDTKDLYCIDFVCHGMPTNAAWEAYKKSHTNIQKVNMRDKSTGWSRYNYSWRFQLKNGNVKLQSQRDNSYMRGFGANLYLRTACYQCKYKGIDRLTDITLGDYWGVWDFHSSMDDNKGTSLVLLHSQKGKALFQAILDQLVYEKANMDAAIKRNPCIVKNVSPHYNSQKFQEKIKNDADFDKTVEELLQSPGLLRRIASKLKS